MFVCFPPIPPPPSPSSLPRFALNHTQKPGAVYLPSLEGCGPKSQPLNSPQKRGRCHSRPSPFQRDVGDSFSLKGGIGEVEKWGGTQELQGPRSMSRNMSPNASSGMPHNDKGWEDRDSTTITQILRCCGFLDLTTTTWFQRQREFYDNATSSMAFDDNNMDSTMWNLPPIICPSPLLSSDSFSTTANIPTLCLPSPEGWAMILVRDAGMCGEREKGGWEQENRGESKGPVGVQRNEPWHSWFVFNLPSFINPHPNWHLWTQPAQQRDPTTTTGKHKPIYCPSPLARDVGPPLSL